MSQHINLFNPALLKKRDWLALPNVVLLYVLCTLVMLGLNFYQRSVLAQVQLIHQQREKQLAAVTVRLGALKQNSDESSKRQAQQHAVQTLTQQKTEQSKVLRVLQSIESNHQQHHLLDYMQALASQQIKGVWLTGFHLDVISNKVTVQGQALNADLIPEYIAGLGQAAVFKGQTFAGLSVQTQEIHKAQEGSEKNKLNTVASTANGAGNSAGGNSTSGKNEQTAPGAKESLTVLSFEFGDLEQMTSRSVAAVTTTATSAATQRASASPSPLAGALPTDISALSQLISQDSAAQSSALSALASQLLQTINSGKNQHE